MAAPAFWLFSWDDLDQQGAEYPDEGCWSSGFSPSSHCQLAVVHLAVVLHRKINEAIHGTRQGKCQAPATAAADVPFTSPPLSLDSCARSSARRRASRSPLISVSSPVRVPCFDSTSAALGGDHDQSRWRVCDSKAAHTVLYCTVQAFDQCRLRCILMHTRGLPKAMRLPTAFLSAVQYHYSPSPPATRP